MTNPHGTPIWYELLTPDPDASKRFYDDAIGWTVEAKPSGEMDYRMIDTGDGLVGGVFRLTPEMTQGGARPTWLFYIGVDDVDATVEAIREAGGGVTMGPWDVPGVGRMAMVTDPQGIPFYVMRGSGEGASTAYDRTGMGKCNWNELTTTDQAAAHDFYARLFSWRYPDGMPMGAMGDYVFVEAAGTTIGATMTRHPEGSPAGWRFYFRAPDIDAAARQVEAGGGSVHHGPVEVPGGEWTILASDPHGAVFGVVGPAREA